MTARKPNNLKAEILHQYGCLNPKPDAVQDELFLSTDFFDPRDLLQVKYEMVRHVLVQEQPIVQTALSFGVSRPTVYQALNSYKQGGIAALLPQRPGPRRAHKLGEELVNVLIGLLTDNPYLRSAEMVSILEERFNVSVHPSTIKRALLRHQEKKTQ